MRRVVSSRVARSAMLLLILAGAACGSQSAAPDGASAATIDDDDLGSGSAVEQVLAGTTFDVRRDPG